MKIFLASLISVAFVLSGCTGVINGQQAGYGTQQDTIQRIKVVTSFYPLYEIARQVGGDYVDVRNLVPAGAEPHDYELTPKDIAGIYDSQILVVNGANLEPWFDRILPDLQQSKVTIVNESKVLSGSIALTQNDATALNPQYDPHIWLDPVLYGQEVQNFAQALSAVDPVHKDYYSAQAQKFISRISDLDNQFRTGLRNCSLREFVTNHAAFGYMSKRYDLTMISIAGFSPDAEPSAKALSDLIALIKQKNIHYILTESLVSPKIAQTLAGEAGIQTMVLNPLEGLTSEEISQGKDYLSVMAQNLKNLQTALNCG